MKTLIYYPPGEGNKELAENLLAEGLTLEELRRRLADKPGWEAVEREFMYATTQERQQLLTKAEAPRPIVVDVPLSQPDAVYLKRFSVPNYEQLKALKSGVVQQLIRAAELGLYVEIKYVPDPPYQINVLVVDRKERAATEGSLDPSSCSMLPRDAADELLAELLKRLIGEFVDGR